MSPRSVLINFWGSFYFDLLLDFISPFPAVLALGLSAP